MKHSITRKRNYLYEILVILNGIVLIGIWGFILPSLRGAILAGCISYLVLAWTLRLCFQRHHMKGTKFMQENRFSDAAKAFEKSNAFFEKHPNVDKFRFITMFSSSAIAYRDMALNNLGVCYAHMGEIEKAIQTFQLLMERNRKDPYLAPLMENIQKFLAEAEQHRAREEVSPSPCPGPAK